MARYSLGDADYRRLLALRTALRGFLHWSETQAHAAGLTPMHHQLLLAIRGHDDPRGPTIGDVAGYLMLRHHSAVELIQRAGALDLLRRVEDPEDRRVVRLELTDKGAAALEQLTSLHLAELSRLADSLGLVWGEAPRGNRAAGSPSG
ncbi:MAG: MarR family winged helix-turn-helix transcriptional regulator [Streptosporangiaceae bacterium]